MSAVVVLGYVIPLLALKLRFGFGDDDIPIGYGFDLIFISVGALVVGVISTVLLSVRFYRKLSPDS